MVKQKDIRFPEWLDKLIEVLQDNASSAEFSLKFKQDLLKAIPGGFTDWEAVGCKFLSANLQEHIERVEKLEEMSDECKADTLSAIRKCKNYFDSDNKTEAKKTADWVAAAWTAAAWALAFAMWEVAYDRYALLLIELFKAESLGE